MPAPLLAPLETLHRSGYVPAGAVLSHGDAVHHKGLTFLGGFATLPASINPTESRDGDE